MYEIAKVSLNNCGNELKSCERRSVDSHNSSEGSTSNGIHEQEGRVVAEN